MSRTRALQLIVALAIVAFVVIRADPADLWRALRGVDLEPAVVALALNVPVLLLAPLRSSLIFKRLGHDVPPRVTIPATILGFVAGGLTPAASGELLRAQALRDRGGLSFEEGVVAALYERVLSLYLLGLSTVAVFAVANLEAALRAVAVTGAILLLSLPWAAAVLLRRFDGVGPPVEGGSFVSRLFKGGLSIAWRIRFLIEDAGLFARWSLVTLAMFAFIACQYWLLARSVGDGANFADAWTAFGVSTFAGVAALIPFGLGVLDGSLATTLDRLGMTFEQGSAVAVLVRAAVTLPLLFAAATCFLYLQRADAPTVAALPGDAPAKDDPHFR